VDSLTYSNIEKILSKLWLSKNPSHPYNQWIMKAEDSEERLFLSRLDNYLEKLTSLLHSERIRSKLRNPQEFVDTYYELEVGCHLIDNGFDVEFERLLCDEKGNRITPDIFVKEENTIVEVKTLHMSNEEEKGIKSHKVFKFNEAKRIKDDIDTELPKYCGKGFLYPLIIVVCKDLIKPPIISTDDFETVLLYRSDRSIFNGELRRTNDVKYQGLYYVDEGRHASILSGVGYWLRDRMLFYENPKANKNSKISNKFLDFLKT
jgi:hypothetical protein